MIEGIFGGLKFSGLWDLFGYGILLEFLGGLI